MQSVCVCVCVFRASDVALYTEMLIVTVREAVHTVPSPLSQLIRNEYAPRYEVQAFSIAAAGNGCKLLAVEERMLPRLLRAALL